MSTITWEQFQTAFVAAPAPVQQLLNSDTIPNLVDRLIAEYQLPTTQRPALIDSIGNAALKLAPLTNALSFITIAPDKQAQFLQTIQNVIGVNKPAAGDIDMQSYMQEGETTPTAPTQPAAAEAAVTPTQPVAATASPVQNVRQTGSLRTMGQDMGRLQHGYAAQSATPTPASKPEDTIVQSLSQDELRGKHAEVPDYSKHG